ncbi:MAG: filamentous hemagglutinin N-terminal domain-containing protein [Arcobacteraceae bacterium]
MKFRQSMAIFVSFILVVEQTALYAGGIEVDAQAPNANKATLLNAPNNVPIVNIVTPNASGLSHNKFTDFNVNNKGLILNNSKVITNTQLAGYISYNPNLTGSEAKLILNEVTSTNKTLLQGYTEVAGKSADVIIANQNGISVNGGGFINTPNATLTTGTPMLNGGILQGFDVSGGNIIIEGNGFNSNNLDKVNLYAKALELNAKIYANELNVVTGENNISQDGTVTSKNQSGIGIAIDSTLLGGIYANTITLKSTDKGVGVNLPPEVIAQDNLKLNADGKIVLDKVISEKNIDIKSTSSDITSKTIYAQNVNIEAKGNIRNENIIASKVNIDLKAKSIVNENIIASGVTEELKDSITGTLTINSEELENKKTLYAKDNIDIKSTIITSNNSNIQALGGINIISDKLQSQDSFIFANKNIFLEGEDVILDRSIIYNVLDDMNILIHANNNLSIANSNILTNSNASLEATNGTLTFGDSNIMTKNSLNLIANSIKGNGIISTKIFSGNELNIISNTDLTDLDNTNISSANTINLKTRANTITLNNAQINSNNTISFSSENLNLNNSKINTVNKDMQISLENTNRLALNNSSILTDNFIFDKEEVSSSLVSLSNKSVIKSGNTNANITLKANDVIITDSNILTQGKLTLSSKDMFDLNNITFLANTGLYLNTIKDFTYDVNKELLSDKFISIASKSFTNNKDFISNGDIYITTTNGNLVNNKLLSSTDTNLNISGNIINNAILASTNLNANASSFYNNNYLTATNNMNLNINNDFINKAAIATGNDLTIYANNLTNYNTIYSNNNINLYIKNNLLNETNEDYASGLDYARIYAKNNIIIAKDINRNYLNNMTNKSAIIETERGDIGIWADTLTNRRILDYTDDAFLTSESITDSIYFEEGKSYPNKGENGIVNNFFITRGQDIHLFANDSEFSLIIDLAREPFRFHYATVDVTLDKKVQYDNPLYKGAKISSGQNLNLNVKNIDNQISTISAVKDINFNTNTITNYYDRNYNTNISFKTYHTREGRPYSYNSEHYLVECLDSDPTCNYGIYASAQSGVLRRGNTVLKATGGNVLGDYDYGTYTTTQSIGLGGTILAGGSINGVAQNLINGTVLDNQTIFPTAYTDSSKITTNRTKSNEIKYDDENKDTINSISSLDNLAPIALPTNEFGMFKKTTNPKANYIIESNPIYTDVSKFISSAYFLEKLGYDVEENTKLLGDGMYETKLIRDEVIRQTGQRFINWTNVSTPITSDYEQYMALMDNAISISDGLKLEVGVPLNEEQLALLDRDIVWMEKVVVEGKDVLVPVLYLAGKYTKANGAVINASDEINLGISGTFVNSGTIKASESLALDANEITNKAGSIISDGLTKLTALKDIKNSSGTISGNSVLLQSTDGNVINETYSKTKTIGSNSYETTYTNVGKTGIIEATNGNLIIQAKDAITNTGANLVAKDNVILQTQNEDININALKLEDGHNIYYSGGFDKALNIEHQSSDIQANNIILQSGKDITIEASQLTAENQINLNAQNDVNIQALNDVYYTDVQSTKKGRFSKKTQRDMTYKESVVQSNLKGGNIYISSGNDINLEAVNINAKNEKVAYAENSLNILAKTYKEGELHHTSKSSWGGMIKSEYKYEKDNLKIKSTEITADNMILDAKAINIEASKLKANSVEISTEILNMISSKETLYENEFSIKGGILTATIENKGKIEEVVVPSTIEVNDKLIFNKKDITDQLSTDNLIKTLSSQGDLTAEQINLIKQIANSKEWQDKTTTLSGVGALIITAIVTYFTAGAGTGIVSGISNAALQTATQAAIQSVVVQATTSLVASVITGNQPKLDLASLVASAVTAGILSYANTTLGTNALTENMDVSDYVKNASINGIGQGISSEIRGGEFKDGFVTGAIISVVSDGALQMRRYQETNYDYPGKNDENAIEITRTNLTGNQSILGNRELAGAFPTLEIIDGKPNFIDGTGLTGGNVFGDRTLFGVKIDKTGFYGYVLENFAGPHDFMSSWNYQNIYNQTSLMNSGLFTEIGSGLLLVPATPFAVGTFIQDNYQYIQDTRYLLKENKEKRETIMNKYKESK